LPTFLNLQPWLPQWNEALSDRHPGLEPPLPIAGTVALNLDVLQGRGTVTIQQSPTAENNYETIIKLQDTEFGADWYVFSLDWSIAAENQPKGD
jgi:hypothetical protein